VLNHQLRFISKRWRRLQFLPLTVLQLTASVSRLCAEVTCTRRCQGQAPLLD
jgi:hypothetical protein